MAVVPLTAGQQQAVDALVAAQDFQKVPADETQARRFGEQARLTLVDVPNVTQALNKYDLAYRAAHDVGEAMLRAYGYKNTSGDRAPTRGSRASWPPSSTPRHPARLPRTSRSCAATETTTTTGQSW